MNNRLEVDRHDFVSAFKSLRKCGDHSQALLAFEGGYLSIEVDDRAAVMRASGEWHGRARFSGNVVRALASVPPASDPVVFELRDDRVRIGTMAIGCKWETVSAKFIRDATKPDYLDLLAMDRTLPRAEIRGTGLARKIRTAETVLAGRVAKAAKLLEVADIDESDLWELVEQNILLRMEFDED